MWSGKAHRRTGVEVAQYWGRPSLQGIIMAPRAESRWVPVALGLSLLLTACAGDEVVKPRAGALPLRADLVAGADFYASPSGSASGDGSFTNPWDLATALSRPAAVTPGSTIWLRGGTYTNPADPRGFESTLTGAPDAPIVVRQYPGEHTTLTNTLLVTGADTWFWGFEVTQPAPQPLETLHGVNVHGPRTKLINLIVHDATDAGIRSEEHTSELQSLAYLVCRLLLEKK